MTPQRRAQIMHHIANIHRPEEISLFLKALGKNRDGDVSEAQDCDVFAACHRRIAAIQGRRKGRK